MKSFTINKNKYKKEGSQAPDYKMSVKMGEEFVEIGGCWLKDGKSGKFFSCKLNDVYVDNVKGVARKGFQITEDGMTPTAKAMPPMRDEEDTQEIPF